MTAGSMAAGHAAAAAPAHKPVNKWLVTVSITFGTLMGAIDSSIVNVAVPHLMGSLGVTVEEVTWVLTGFVIATVIVMPLTGFLARMFGQKRVYMTCLVIFIVGSALCGMARSLTLLVIFRIIQGMGAGALQPTEQAILRQTFPLEEQGMAMAVFGMAVVLGPAFGPTLGGYIVDNYSWPWIFYINVPIGIAALVATFLIIPDLRPGRSHGWDFLGTVVATAGLFGIVFGLIEGQRYSWGQIESYPITIPEVIGAGVVLLVLFVIWERFQAEPLVPLSLFADRNFAVANWLAAAVSFGMLSTFLPLTIYLQSVRGFSALVAGLTLAPMSVTSMVVAPFAGRAADRIGGKYILMTGLGLFTVGIATIANVAGPDSTWINFLVPAIVAGAGIGLTFAPMTTVAMRNIQPQVAGAASAVLNTIRQLGAAIGSAVIGAILQNQLATTLHDQAVLRSTSLPPAFRDQFIRTFSNVSSRGFEIGAGQTGASLPAGIPPAVAQQITAVAHAAFVNGYIDAMKSTFVVPVVFLALTMVSALLIQRRKRPSAVEQPREEVRAAAG